MLPRSNTDDYDASTNNRNIPQKTMMKCAGCQKQISVGRTYSKIIDDFSMSFRCPFYLFNKNPVFLEGRKYEVDKKIDQFYLYCHSCYVSGVYFNHFICVNNHHYGQLYEAVRKQ
jgi:hypothetical protein